MQIELPGLTHQFLPEAVVRFLTDQGKAGALVDVPGRRQHAIGPQRYFAVSGPAGEPLAFGHQSAADAQTARLRFDE
jgi:hypothetical protein